MKTTAMKKRWNAIVLGALVFGAIALVAIVGAGGAKQNNTAQSTANASGANAVVAVVPTAQDDAPLLDAWDRAEALHWHGTATPTEEMPPADTLDRAAPFPQNNAHAQATETPLLDAIDRAEALKHSSTPTPTEDPTDLSDRHSPEELNAIIAGQSK